MKATNLIIGQKYNWVQNLESTHIVEYVGTDYCGSVLVYVFKYIHNGKLKYSELPVVHCERDIKEIKLNDLLYTNGFYSALPKLKEADLKVGTIMRENSGKSIHTIISIDGNIITYNDLSGFKSLSNEDGLFRDTKAVVLDCFEFVR